MLNKAHKIGHFRFIASALKHFVWNFCKGGSNFNTDPCSLVSKLSCTLDEVRMFSNKTFGCRRLRYSNLYLVTRVLRESFLHVVLETVTLDNAFDS